MTGDPNKGLPLPSGPASLCFDKDIFMQENFDVDQFVIECRRRVPLENLRDDLNTYLKILRSAMIELINKDYADFVNLSTNLVGMDKAIGNLTVPLEQLKDEVLNVKTAMEEAVHAVEEKLRKREQVRQKKASLQRLVNIIHSVEKIEKLLGIHSAESSSMPGQLNGQLIERVANEFNKLQFYVTKSKGLPLVENIKPRIANITTTLQYSLEGQLVEGLKRGNVPVLHQCLRTYALIDKIKDAENLFRQNIVKPYMEEVISEQFLKSNSEGLQGMYKKVLEFIPTHCKVLKEVTLSGSSGSSEVVRGYDFLVNAVWPEIVANIEARTHSIFAPGNPDVFHKKFKVSMKFLEDFEKHCGTQASVKRLRDHPSYHTYMTKWSLPVYYQIRFQDIAGEFESALDIPFNKSADSSSFLLHSTSVLWASLQRCWSDDVYLDLLCNKFWKLNLQMFSRYSHWLDECYESEITNRKQREKEIEEQRNKVPVPSEKQNGSGEKAINTERERTPQPPPVTTSQLLCLIVDAQSLSSHIFQLFDETIKEKMASVGFTDLDSIKEVLQECSAEIGSKLPQFQAYIVEEITSQCSVHLKQVNDIPRLYRRTNKEIPSKPSSYINSLLKPLRMFNEEHGDVLSDDLKREMYHQVLCGVTQLYVSATGDVLMSVKKVEDSLKRLKKSRGTDKTSGNQGVTDDDKIRQQFIVDIENYGKQISEYGEFSTLESYVKLQNLAEEAKQSMTAVQS